MKNMTMALKFQKTPYLLASPILTMKPQCNGQWMIQWGPKEPYSTTESSHTNSRPHFPSLQSRHTISPSLSLSPSPSLPTPRPNSHPHSPSSRRTRTWANLSPPP
ncbi:hypothetical protein PanWU01x14_164620 [Parasponia andersonii]|uniref:Uncharacterized protein n=1 Tax=Parasponia andersonii TaxID=3476 RepID=A0A2P5CCD5_PARAD|nr:hypothetical protein PanWU01x14_164620 [Parasponia andersonii]